MFRQQVTQISNCTCKIIPPKNQYMMFRSPESISNKKYELKEKFSLKTHSTSAQKKYGGAISSQKKSLKQKNINENSKLGQNQTLCNNFDTQKQIYHSPQHMSKKVHKYNHKENFKTTIIQPNLKMKKQKSQFAQDQYQKKRLNVQKKDGKASQKIKQCSKDPLDFAQINFNFVQRHQNRPTTQYQIKQNLACYGKYENSNKLQLQKCSPSDVYAKKIGDRIKIKNQILPYIKSKNKQNQSLNLNLTINNYTASVNNFNFDKIRDYKNQTIFQREQQPSKKPYVQFNQNRQISQIFHESLQKFYPRSTVKDICLGVPLIVEQKTLIENTRPKTLIQNTRPKHHQNNKNREDHANHFQISQSRIKFVQNNQNQSIGRTLNQSTIKQSKSFATTVTNSILPNIVQNDSQLSNKQRQVSNNSNYASAFKSNMNLDVMRKTLNRYQKTDINDKLKTFNDLMSNQNQTQSVYEGQDQNQNDFSQVVMSYRNIFQKSGIVQPVHYRLLSQDQYQNKHQTYTKLKDRQSSRKFCNYKAKVKVQKQQRISQNKAQMRIND